VRAGGLESDRARPPLGTRLFVGVFLAAFTICGLAGIEAWPLTGWHLFSALRHPDLVGWRAVLVDGQGNETPFPLTDLPLAYRGSQLLINRFESITPADQEGLCETLLKGARTLNIKASFVRIYRVDRDESRRVGERAASEVLTPRYRCGDGSVQAAGP
jgi:hypothetical protein